VDDRARPRTRLRLMLFVPARLPASAKARAVPREVAATIAPRAMGLASGNWRVSAIDSITRRGARHDDRVELIGKREARRDVGNDRIAEPAVIRCDHLRRSRSHPRLLRASSEQRIPETPAPDSRPVPKRRTRCHRPHSLSPTWSDSLTMAQRFSFAQYLFIWPFCMKPYRRATIGYL